METIETNVQLLIWSIKRSPEYKEYKRSEDALKKYPELKARADEYRARNYKIQNSVDDTNAFQIMADLSHESEVLHKIPVVHDYLQAELGVCRLLQNISLEIIGGLDIHIANV